MEIAAEIRIQLVLSSLIRTVSILKENYGDVESIEGMKPLYDFIDFKIDAFTREAKSDDSVQLMPLLEELYVAALELEGLLVSCEYEQTNERVNSSSSESLPEEKVLPTHLRNGLNKLLKIVERVENRRSATQPQADTLAPTTSSTILSPYFDQENQNDSFLDFLLVESRHSQLSSMCTLWRLSNLIELLGTSPITNHSAWKQLKDAVRCGIQSLIKSLNFDDLAKSMRFLELIQSASLELDLLDADEDYYTEKQDSSPNSIPLNEFSPIFKEEAGSVSFKSPLWIGLEKLLKFVELVEKKHPLIASGTGKTQSQANTSVPTLRIGVEKWLKFVEQLEKEYPLITSKDDKTHRQAYTATPIRTSLYACCGLLPTMRLENVKCQEDVEEIMRNHKKNPKRLIFGWINMGRSNDGILERLEPDQNLENLSILQYPCAKFPSWMVKEYWLPHLQTLELRSCRCIKIVPFLPPRLQQLSVCNCGVLMQLPPLSVTLRKLKLCYCPKLMPPSMFYDSSELSDLSFLTNLEKLSLKGFPTLQALSNLSTTVSELTIEDCPKLTSLVNLQRCTSLEHLSISKCPIIMKGVVEGDITNRLLRLKYISTDDPLLVLELFPQEAFSSTEVLHLHGLQRSFLPVSDECFQYFSSLTCLVLKDCAVLPNLEKLSSLFSLYIFSCPKVLKLPNLPVSLQRLWINDCGTLELNYEEGSYHRSTISHIPHIDIP